MFIEHENYYAYSASLRIFGKIPDFDVITKIVGVTPTYFHRKGEKRFEKLPPFNQDMWRFNSILPEEHSLSEHLNAIWKVVKPKANEIKELKNRLSVDIFCGYRSNCDHSGFNIDYQSLEIFRVLEIPLDVSVIIA